MPKKTSKKLRKRKVLSRKKEYKDSKDDFFHRFLMMQEEEKRRISRDLHDEVGQVAISLGAYLNIVEKAIKEGDVNKAFSLIEENRQQIKELASRMKAMALNLRPPALDILGLSAVLREYFSHCTSLNPVRIEFNENLKGAKFNGTVEINLYRVVQEAIYNVMKHSEATEVKVGLFHSDGELTLEIQDNGKGFDFETFKQNPDPTKMGLRSIEERINMLQGRFSIASAPEKGVRLAITIPLQGLL